MALPQLALRVLSRGVYATAELHVDAQTGNITPLLLVRLGSPIYDQLPVPRSSLQRLRAQGWGDPARLLRGADLDSTAAVSIDGVLGEGPVTIGCGGRILFHGPVDRPPPWVAAVRDAGVVPVVISAAAGLEDLTTLARAGLVVAAHARLFHRGPRIAAPTLEV